VAGDWRAGGPGGGRGGDAVVRGGGCHGGREVVGEGVEACRDGWGRWHAGSGEIRSAGVRCRTGGGHAEGALDGRGGPIGVGGR
jgi:hypothetical protein